MALAGENLNFFIVFWDQGAVIGSKWVKTNWACSLWWPPVGIHRFSGHLNRKPEFYDFRSTLTHFHLFPATGTRLDFPMENVLDQMEWAFDHVSPHFKAAIAQHPRAELRGSTLSIPRPIQEKVDAELKKLWREAPWEKVH